jgi:branched-chain amino acid transport system ATP-binding protein
MAMLDVQGAEIRYGVVPAVRDLTLHVDEGEIVALLGANGAGKSTTLRMISGLHHASSGSVTFNGREIRTLAPHSVVELGIIHVPEGRRIFSAMTVEENLEMGSFRHRRGSTVGLDAIYETFPILHERRKQLGSNLSGGEQQMLAIGRALMAEPTLLLLDEPSLGLAPLIVEQIFSIIKSISDQGVTILLVEQNALKALELADRGYVLETGVIALQGDAKDLLADDRVRMAYLGEDIGSEKGEASEAATSATD